MSASFRLRQRGLSLVELLLGLAITALVLAPLVPMLRTASAAAAIGADQTAIEREADFALGRIATRIRATAADKVTPLIGSSCDTDETTPVQYKVAEKVLKDTEGTGYVLAESVDCITLASTVSSTGQTFVTVSLALARGDASTTATAVVPLGVPL